MAVYIFNEDDYIYRINLDDPADAVEVFIQGVSVLALAISPHKVYWIGNNIQRADLDGSNIRTVNITHGELFGVSWLEVYDHYLLGINDIDGIIYRVDINSGEVITWSPEGYYVEKICKHEAFGNLGLSTVGTTNGDLQFSTTPWSAVTESEDPAFTSTVDEVLQISTLALSASTVTNEDSKKSSASSYLIVTVVILGVIILAGVPALVFYSRFYYHHKSKKTDAFIYDDVDVSKGKSKLADESYEVPMTAFNHDYAQAVSSNTEVDKPPDEDIHTYTSIIDPVYINSKN